MAIDHRPVGENLMIEPYQGVWPRIDPSAYIHPTAVIIGRVTIGPGSSIWPHAVLRGDDGDIIIGARSSIQDGTVIHTTESLSRTVVGDHVTVGHRVVLHGCAVRDYCIVGMGSVLLDNAELEDHCILGAGSILTQNKRIPAGSMAFGNPAKVVRPLNEKELAWIEYSWKRYVENGAICRAATVDEPSGEERGSGGI
jgi:carbonic anhydrase/acetyltransferase-like protein (isoleucine patch superfamily)